MDKTLELLNFFEFLGLSSAAQKNTEFFWVSRWVIYSPSYLAPLALTIIASAFGSNSEAL